MLRYGEIVLELMTAPVNEGVMAEADCVGVYGTVGGGGFGAIYLKVRGDRVVRCTFRCHGCGASIAAFSCLTILVERKTLSECREIEAEMLLEELGGLPADKRHCAQRAITALQNALESLKNKHNAERPSE